MIRIPFDSPPFTICGMQRKEMAVWKMRIKAGALRNGCARGPRSSRRAGATPWMKTKKKKKRKRVKLKREKGKKERGQFPFRPALRATTACSLHYASTDNFHGCAVFEKRSGKKADPGGFYAPLYLATRQYPFRKGQLRLTFSYALSIQRYESPFLLFPFPFFSLKKLIHLPHE